jgi:serine phosphatase RsbU (regulator of sigma subunit)
MARTVSIRQSLLRNLVLLIVLLSGAVLVTLATGARRVVRELSRSVIERALGKTEEQLARFFDPATDQLRLAQSWGERGLLDLDDPDRLRRLLWPMIKLHPQISSLMVADGRGREFGLIRMGDKWVNRQTRRDEWGDKVRWIEWTDDPAKPTESWKTLDYDPRTRPWYNGAIKKHSATRTPSAPTDEIAEIHWTDPYTFFTTQDPGITASVTFDAGDGRDHVIGFDVLVNDISEFTMNIDVSDHGKAFVSTEDFRVIGLPKDPRFEDPQARRAALLKQPIELDLPVASDAANVFRKLGRLDTQAIRFESEGKPWWCQTRPYSLAPERTLWIGVMLPESDLLGELTRLRVWILLITLGVLALAIRRAVVLAHRASSPIEALVRQSDRISRGDLEPGPPIISDMTEVKRLAEAQDRMRDGLQSLMKLERDIQLARQIQQSTFPKHLPTLKGFQITAWNEPADETGGDSYDVIGYRHGSNGQAVTLTDQKADGAVFMLADATGHGIGPALSVTQFRAMLRMAVRGDWEPQTIARQINEQLCADMTDGRFITAWFGQLNVKNNTLRSFSAGQAPILRYLAGQMRWEVSNADVLPFGIMADTKMIAGEPIVMNPGDVFAVISDGIFESANPAGELFGTQRVIDVLDNHCKAKPEDMLTALREAVDAFTHSAPAEDDRTAVIIKRVRR